MNGLENLQLGDTKTSVMMTDGVLVFILIVDILGIKFVLCLYNFSSNMLRTTSQM